MKLRPIAAALALLVAGLALGQDGQAPEGPSPLKPAEIAAKAREALAPETTPEARFQAVRDLAISPCTPESAKALAQIACDPDAEATTRGYAAMGLRNFTRALPPDLKAAIRDDLRKTLAREDADTPDEILRVLIAWGDAPLIDETLGPRLVGHPMQIDVLEALPGKEAAERLWDLYQATQKGRTPLHYSRRAAIGRALLERRDKRGVDIFLDLLPQGNAPGPQYRNNVYNLIASRIGQDFGYPPGNYRPALEDAIPRMIDWWQKRRETFQFPEPPRQ